MDIASMEPLVPAEGAQALDDEAVALIAESHQLAGRIHPILRDSIGDLVRSMNCYYSNLIEGHDTHPRDIERALASEYSQNAQKRVLQHEASAHIEVQKMIDFRTDLSASVTSVEYIHWVHREFCSRLPDDLLWVTDPENKQKLHVVPGENRLVDVVVGRHVPPAASDLAA